MKTALDGEGSSWSSPSIRSRNLQQSSNGSRWMSLEPLAHGLIEDLVHHANDPAILVVGRRSVDVEDAVIGLALVIAGVLAIECCDVRLLDQDEVGDERGVL